MKRDFTLKIQGYEAKIQKIEKVQSWEPCTRTKNRLEKNKEKIPNNKVIWEENTQILEQKHHYISKRNKNHVASKQLGQWKEYQGNPSIP